MRTRHGRISTIGAWGGKVRAYAQQLGRRRGGGLRSAQLQAGVVGQQREPDLDLGDSVRCAASASCRARHAALSATTAKTAACAGRCSRTSKRSMTTVRAKAVRSIALSSSCPSRRGDASHGPRGYRFTRHARTGLAPETERDRGVAVVPPSTAGTDGRAASMQEMSGPYSDLTPQFRSTAGGWQQASRLPGSLPLEAAWSNCRRLLRQSERRGYALALSKVQSVDQRMRLECGVRFRQLRTCRRTRPGQLCADIVAKVDFRR